MTTTRTIEKPFAGLRYRRDARPTTASPPAAGAGWRNRVLEGDALTTLRTLPEACVDTVVTSPP